MSESKQRAVVRAEKSQIERVRRLVDAGKCRTVSDFVHDALEEKLARAEHPARNPAGHPEIAEAVEHYCSEGHADEDADLIDTQAFESASPPARRKER